MRNISKYRKEIMGIAALMIYLFHAWRPLTPQGSIFRSGGDALLFCLQSGTDIFFLLSGMGLVYAWDKADGLTDFYLRRAERILLPIWLSGTIVAIQQDWSASEYVLKVSGVDFYRVHIFSYSWFYAAIMTLYLLFPLYRKLFSGARNKYRFTAAAAILWIMLSVFLQPVIRRDFYMALNRTGVFLLGVLIGWMLREGYEYTFRRVHYGIAVCALAVGFYMMRVSLADDTLLPVPIGYTWLPAGVSACGIIVLGCGILERLKARNGGGILFRVLRFYGTISLEFICIQEWLGTAYDRSGIVLPDAAVNVIFLILHTAFAYGYHCLNHWFLTSVRRRSELLTQLPVPRQT